MPSFQRIGSTSNAHVGNDFERLADGFFASTGITLSRGFAVPLGVADLKKVRRFDLGSENPSILVECKAHTWTEGGNIPSAKLTVWNESMYYFHIAPEQYRKVMFVQKSFSERRQVTLAKYYLRNYAHLIPKGVEFWELDCESLMPERVR